MRDVCVEAADVHGEDPSFGKEAVIRKRKVVQDSECVTAVFDVCW